MYFVGVTTGQSSIHALFPKWAELAGVPGARLVGMDLEVEAEPHEFRTALERIKHDGDSWGALVTTHKISLVEHGRDLFNEFDADARLLGEVSCIIRRDRKLKGLALDTITAGNAMADAWGSMAPPAKVLIMGAGGAGVALALHLQRAGITAVTLTDISSDRISRASTVVTAETRIVAGPPDHDELIATLPAGSLIVNATGMGKDRPGSPVTERVRFPDASVAWDFNYRGNLAFLDLARQQGTRVVDGWTYFLHGWSQIMSRVFDFELTAALFTALAGAATR